MRALLTALFVIASTLTPISARADDWGCQVLLCLSNPKGPTAVAECVDPINRLWKQLRRGKPFPSCDLGQGSDGPTRAVQSLNYYDPCPSGTTPLPVGAVVDTGSGLMEGIGDGSGVTPNPEGQLPALACVAGFKGTQTVLANPGGDYPYYAEVSQYGTIIYQPPRGSGNVLDVYIDGQLFSRVPY